MPASFMILKKHLYNKNKNAKKTCLNLQCGAIILSKKAVFLGHLKVNYKRFFIGHGCFTHFWDSDYGGLAL